MSRQRGIAVNGAAGAADDLSVNVGEILGDAGRGYRRLAPYLAVLTLLGNLSIAAYCVVLVLLLGDWGVVGGVVVGAVGVAWLVALLVQTIHDLQQGDGEAWLGARVRRIWPRINAVSAACVLVYGLLIVAEVLFALSRLAPGVIVFVAWFVLALRWSVALPAVVIEGRGAIDALRRSNELVRGHGWRVFCVLFVTGLLSGLVDRAASAVARAAIGSETAAALVAYFASLTLFLPFTALVLAVLYERLASLGGAKAPAPAAA